MRLNIKRFSISAANDTSLTAPASSTYKYTLTVSFTETGTSTANNTSTLTCTATLGASKIAYSVGGGGTLAVYWHDNNTNSDVLVSSITVDSCGKNYGTKTVSDSVTVNHKSDGTLRGYAKAVFTKVKSNSYIPATGNVSTSNTDLTTIPRASTVSCTDAYIGANPTFTITKKAGVNYKHTLKYSFNGKTGTIATGINNSTSSSAITYNSWTIPNTTGTNSFYDKIPGTEGIGTITCETYNESNVLVGSNTCNFKVKVPTSAKPNISNPTLYDNDSVSRGIGVYVVNKSQIKFTFPSFSSSYSTTLKSYTLKINGTQVANGTSTTYTMPNVLKSTSTTYELIITDARGNSNTTGVKTITAYNYTVPSCSITAERDSSNSEQVNITYKGNITNLNNNNNNNKSFALYYKPSSAGNSGWTQIGTTITNSYSVNGTAQQSSIDDETSYDFKIVATDSYGSSTRTTTVSTAATLLNFRADGTGMGIGKVSENSNRLEIGLRTDFKNSVYDNNILVRDNIIYRDYNTTVTATGHAMTHTTYTPPTIDGYTCIANVLRGWTSNYIIPILCADGKISLWNTTGELTFTIYARFIYKRN